ncbi:hypothetical protein CYLTODRAFT_425987 [Cylindrobasidium torrendii FP15055 ss-10]|uniref:SWIM-type domain-containing protein n=1 Tax=Cylindrobasidium torrendii FP15055 ss-10 TaxID=1314674 RepID=A0A0D7B0C0_9AGAR|nr:hypothetical protein CYLTODRAFT_425987 [Cylindrobasidium torrendii FP15055 ss-10]
MPPRKRTRAESDYASSLDNEASGVDEPTSSTAKTGRKSAGAAKAVETTATNARKRQKKSKGEVDEEAPASTKKVAGKKGKDSVKKEKNTVTGAAKKEKDGEDGSEPPEEKRLARWKLKCPEEVRNRYAMTTKKFYILGREKVGEVEEHFKIGILTKDEEVSKIVNVVIGHRLTCDCPYGQKNPNNCEHILIVFWRVLKVPNSSNLWYQRALITSELQGIFADAPPPISRPKGAEKRSLEDDVFECPVCFSRIYDKKDSKFSNANSETGWCEECGEAIHQGCLEQWRKVNGKTCVSCGDVKNA